MAKSTVLSGLTTLALLIVSCSKTNFEAVQPTLAVRPPTSPIAIQPLPVIDKFNDFHPDSYELVGRNFDLNAVMKINGVEQKGFINHIYATWYIDLELNPSSSVNTAEQGLDVWSYAATNPSVFTVTEGGRTSAPFTYYFYPLVDNTGPILVTRGSVLNLTGRFLGTPGVQPNLRVYFLMPTTSGPIKYYVANPTIMDADNLHIRMTIPDYGAARFNAVPPGASRNFYFELTAGDKVTTQVFNYLQP